MNSLHHQIVFNVTAKSVDTIREPSGIVCRPMFSIFASVNSVGVRKQYLDLYYRILSKSKWLTVWKCHLSFKLYFQICCGYTSPCQKHIKQISIHNLLFEWIPLFRILKTPSKSFTKKEHPGEATRFSSCMVT